MACEIRESRKKDVPVAVSLVMWGREDMMVKSEDECALPKNMVKVFQPPTPPSQFNLNIF